MIGLNGELVVIKVCLLVYVSMLDGRVLVLWVGFDSGMMIGCLYWVVIVLMMFLVKVLGWVE